MADQKAIYEIKLKDSFSGGLKSIDKGVDKFEKNTLAANKKVGSSFDTLKNRLVGLGLAAGAGVLIKNIATLGIEMEQTRVSFTTFLGSAEKANKAIADLNEFSNVTPFDNAQVIKAGKGLLAFGVSQNKLIPSLKKIGDISAGTGKDFNELATIYGKARVAGTLYAEDINQLVEAGVPIMGEFAKALGTTEDKVKKMASEGKLKFKDLETAFSNLTGEGGMFFNLMEKQSQTVGGRLSTLLGKMQGLGIAIGTALLPAIGLFTDLALGLVENTGLLTDMAIVLGTVAGGFAAYAIGAKVAAAATWIAAGGFQALAAAMIANPIGLVVAGLAALTAGIIIAYRRSATFRNVLSGLWESAKTVFQNLKNGFTELPNIIISALKGIPRAIAGIFKDVGSLFSAIMSGDFSGVVSSLKSLGMNILKSNPMSAVALGIGEKLGEGVGDSFKKGVSKQIAKDAAKGLEGDKTTESQTFAQATTGAAATSKASNVSSGITGSSPKNVTLNIDRLVETINFNSQKLEKSTSEMTDMVKRALLTALNDAAIVQQ